MNVRTVRRYELVSCTLSTSVEGSNSTLFAMISQTKEDAMT